MTPYDSDLFSSDVPAAPPVIGAEPVDAQQEPSDEPEPVVFLPSAEPASSPDSEVTFHLFRADDGQLALPAFTSLETLVAVFGEPQAWVCVERERVESIRQASGAAHVVWDPAPTEDSD